MTSTERYTLGYDPRAMKFLVRRTLESHGAFILPFLSPGMQVLDAGCGPGVMTLDLARRLGDGMVVGLDMNEAQVRMGAQAATEEGLANAHFRAGSAYALPFPDASFDLVFSHALLEHLREPQRAMAEFQRVLKPGGVVGVATPDWGGFLFAPPSPALTGAVQAYMDLQQRNGGDVFIGRRLAQLAVEAGFEQVRERARYENYDPLSIIGELLAFQLEDDGQHEHAATLRAWQRTPYGMFSQAWVACTGRKPLR
jgi:ubiquinone/menaquinone biosynthesis C-methylase UbiE